MPVDFYSELGVDRSATQEDIRRAYRRLVRRLHPDAPGHDAADDDRLHEVLEAYSVVGNPMRRAVYDQALRQSEAVMPFLSPLAHSRPLAWHDRSVFDEPDLLRFLFPWFR